jgi:hypothetical protein
MLPDDISPHDTFLRPLIDCRPQAYGPRPAINGFYHGLKSVHRTLFAPVSGLVPPFRILCPPPPNKKPEAGEDGFVAFFASEKLRCHARPAGHEQ